MGSICYRQSLKKINGSDSILFMNELIQGWEFAHRFSERIARFLRKNEQMSDLLKKTSNSLIRSFLVSDLSDSLTSLIKKEGMSESLIF